MRKLSSKEIKTKLLHFYRFRKRYKFIATEAGKLESDVLVSDEKEILEIEVKISLADFKNDFKKKKHGIYKNPTAYYKSFLPNKFYFCVPQDLVKEVLPFLKGTPYGLLVCLEDEITKKGTFIKSVIPAQNLRSGISKKLLHALILRMGSELIRTRIKDLCYPED
jgi:hypothetical protein